MAAKRVRGFPRTRGNIDASRGARGNRRRDAHDFGVVLPASCADLRGTSDDRGEILQVLRFDLRIDLQRLGAIHDAQKRRRTHQIGAYEFADLDLRSQYAARVRDGDVRSIELKPCQCQLSPCLRECGFRLRDMRLAANPLGSLGAGIVPCVDLGVLLAPGLFDPDPGLGFLDRRFGPLHAKLVLGRIDLHQTFAGFYRAAIAEIRGNPDDAARDFRFQPCPLRQTDRARQLHGQSLPVLRRPDHADHGFGIYRRQSGDRIAFHALGRPCEVQSHRNDTENQDNLKETEPSGPARWGF